MDTPTQALLGATFGQALFGHRLGRKAAWFGALGGIVPDLDGLVAPLLGPLAMWTHHRGVTHALWFGPVVGALLGYGLWRWYAHRSARRDRLGLPPPAAGPPGVLPAGDRRALPWWIGLFVVAVTTHPLLDIFTSYGTQLLAPFSDHRFAIDAVAIIDPVYTLLLVAALVVGSRARLRPQVGRIAAGAALALTTGYLFYALAQNERAIDHVEAQLAEAGVEDAEVHAWPTLFQPYLRRVAVRTPDELRVGYLSTWSPGPIHWRHYPLRDDPEVIAAGATWQGATLDWFAMGWVWPELVRDADGPHVRLWDMRYGLPGARSPAIWGLDVRFSRPGLGGPPAVAEVTKLRRPIEGAGAAFVELWRATFQGDTSRL